MDIQKWKKRKKELKLTHSELAEKSGISRRTIAGIFSEDPRYASPTWNTIQAIDHALGLDSPQSDWTKEERKAGIVDTTKVVLNANEMELIDLYREIGRVHGEKMQQLLLAFANLLLGDHE